MSSPTQGAWECRHGIDGRDHCAECYAPADPTPGDLAGMLAEALHSRSGMKLGPEDCAVCQATADTLARVVADWLRDDAQVEAGAQRAHADECGCSEGPDAAYLRDARAVIAALVERTGATT